MLRYQFLWISSLTNEYVTRISIHIHIKSQIFCYVCGKCILSIDEFIKLVILFNTYEEKTLRGNQTRSRLTPSGFLLNGRWVGEIVSCVMFIGMVISIFFSYKKKKEVWILWEKTLNDQCIELRNCSAILPSQIWLTI